MDDLDLLAIDAELDALGEGLGLKSPPASIGSPRAAYADAIATRILVRDRPFGDRTFLTEYQIYYRHQTAEQRRTKAFYREWLIPEGHFIVLESVGAPMDPYLGPPGRWDPRMDTIYQSRSGTCESEEGCDRPIQARRLCARHYKQWSRSR